MLSHFIYIVAIAYCNSLASASLKIPANLAKGCSPWATKSGSGNSRKKLAITSESDNCCCYAQRSDCWSKAVSISKMILVVIVVHIFKLFHCSHTTVRYEFKEMRSPVYIPATLLSVMLRHILYIAAGKMAVNLKQYPL